MMSVEGEEEGKFECVSCNQECDVEDESPDQLKCEEEDTIVDHAIAKSLGLAGKEERG